MLPRRLSVLLLILVGFVVYFNSLFNGFIVGDDEEQLVNHPLVHSIINIPQFFTGSTYFRAESGRAYGLYYRPLMLSVYSLIYTVVGPDPLVFHAVQAGLHILNAILIFSLFSLLLPEAWALVGAGIFLVHPINSEAVLHIANLQDVLFMTAGLISLIIILRGKKEQTRDWRSDLAVGLCWLVSLFSKETGILFIGLGLFLSRRLFYVAGIVVAVYLGLRMGIAKIDWTSPPISVMARLSAAERLAHVPILAWNYLSRFIWPDMLAVFQMWSIESLSWRNFYGPIGYLFTGLLAWLGVRSNLADKKSAAVFVFFSLWLISGFLIHAQIIPLDATWAERWFYFPSVGLIGMILILLSFIWQRWSKVRGVVMVGIFGMILVWGGRTMRRTFDWRSSDTLLMHDYPLLGDNYYVENLLATLYIREKKYTEAKPYVEKSIRGYANFGNLNNAAVIATSEKDYEKAKEYFEETLKLGRQYGVIVNYANTFLYLMKDERAALGLADKYLAEYPKGFDLWLVKAQAEYKLGNYDRALLAAREAYRLKPFDLSEEVLRAIEGKRKIEVEKYLEL